MDCVNGFLFNKKYVKSETNIGTLAMRMYDLIDRMPGRRHQEAEIGEMVLLPAGLTLFHGTLSDFTLDEMYPWSFFSTNVNPPLGLIGEKSGSTAIECARVIEYVLTRDVEVEITWKDMQRKWLSTVKGEGVIHPFKKQGAVKMPGEEEIRFRDPANVGLMVVRTYEFGSEWVRQMSRHITYGKLKMEEPKHFKYNRKYVPESFLEFLEEQNVDLEFLEVEDRVFSYYMLRQCNGNLDMMMALYGMIRFGVVENNLDTRLHEMTYHCALLFDKRPPNDFVSPAEDMPIYPYTTGEELGVRRINPNRRRRLLGLASWSSFRHIDLVLYGVGTLRWKVVDEQYRLAYLNNVLQNIIRTYLEYENGAITNIIAPSYFWRPTYSFSKRIRYDKAGWKVTPTEPPTFDLKSNLFEDALSSASTRQITNQVIQLYYGLIRGVPEGTGYPLIKHWLKALRRFVKDMISQIVQFPMEDRHYLALFREIYLFVDELNDYAGDISFIDEYHLAAQQLFSPSKYSTRMHVAAKEILPLDKKSDAAAEFLSSIFSVRFSILGEDILDIDLNIADKYKNSVEFQELITYLIGFASTKHHLHSEIVSIGYEHISDKNVLRRVLGKTIISSYTTNEKVRELLLKCRSFGLEDPKFADKTKYLEKQLADPVVLEALIEQFKQAKTTWPMTPLMNSHMQGLFDQMNPESIAEHETLPQLMKMWLTKTDADPYVSFIDSFRPSLETWIVNHQDLSDLDLSEAEEARVFATIDKIEDLFIMIFRYRPRLVIPLNAREEGFPYVHFQCLALDERRKDMRHNYEPGFLTKQRAMDDYQLNVEDLRDVPKTDDGMYDVEKVEIAATWKHGHANLLALRRGDPLTKRRRQPPGIGDDVDAAKCSVCEEDVPKGEMALHRLKKHQ